MRSTPAVLGVLSMVFGGVHAFWSGTSLLTRGSTNTMMTGYGKAFAGLPRRPSDPDPKAMFDQMAHAMDEIRPYLLAINLPLLVFSLALIVVGYELYKRRPRSRGLAVGWSIAALAFVPVLLYVQLTYVVPRTTAAMQSMFANIPGDQQAFMKSFGAMQAVMTIGTYVLLYVPFPVVLLILIGRASAKQDLVASSTVP